MKEIKRKPRCLKLQWIKAKTENRLASLKAWDNPPIAPPTNI